MGGMSHIFKNFLIRVARSTVSIDIVNKNVII